jgi:phage/plasmid-associated DNA primase
MVETQTQQSHRSDRFNRDDEYREHNAVRSVQKRYAINPEYHKRVNQDILQCNGSHNSIAKIAFNILKERFVCASHDNKIWFEFDGNRWVEDKGPVRARQMLSECIREHFIHTMQTVLNNRNDSDKSSTVSVHKNTETTATLLNIALKLQDANFKDNVIREMKEYFYDKHFIDKLDSNKHLIAFDNGVFDFNIMGFRNTLPEDYITYSVGYEYKAEKDLTTAKLVHEYFRMMHPNVDQRDYLLKTIARQLYGDSGNELLHIHAGFRGSAGNGKTRFFEVLGKVLGNYVRKFDVAVLTTKNREESGKPAPQYKYWTGVRILYTSEPNVQDVLHSGIMKDLTGGEQISYRELYSNDMHVFTPQFKMHVMCNDPPKVDGSDEGVKRRIRKIDYISQFVESAKVNESIHCYKRDSTFFDMLAHDDGLKMEVMRYFLEHFDIGYEFIMTDNIAENSRLYLEGNNNVLNFINEFVSKDECEFFTLKSAREMYQAQNYDNMKISTLKQDIENTLEIKCLDQKTFKTIKYKNVFMGFKLVEDINAFPPMLKNQ